MWSGLSHSIMTAYGITTSRLDEGAPDPHPIPVWVASLTGHPRGHPPGRGLRRHLPHPGQPHPAPGRGRLSLLTALHRAGLPDGRAFDVAVAGNASPAWQEPITVDLAALAQAGMTWWMESLIHFDPLELSLEIVDSQAAAACDPEGCCQARQQDHWRSGRGGFRRGA